VGSGICTTNKRGIETEETEDWVTFEWQSGSEKVVKTVAQKRHNIILPPGTISSGRSGQPYEGKPSEGQPYDGQLYESKLYESQHYEC
jgi:hypothetical protein